jgi:hypothetical protein
MVACIKRQLGIDTQVSVIKDNVTVAKNRNSVSANLSLLWPINAKLGEWVAYMKRKLVIATQMSVIKAKDTVSKNRNSVSDQ